MCNYWVISILTQPFKIIPTDIQKPYHIFYKRTHWNLKKLIANKNEWDEQRDEENKVNITFQMKKSV